MLGLLVTLAMLVMVVLAALVVWSLARGAAGEDRHRRWARVAQRVAPTRAEPEFGVDGLLDHVDRQLHSLHGERARLQRLRDRGRQLHYRMRKSATLRARVPQLERVLGELDRRAERLDGLIAAYHQRRDDLLIVRDTARFRADLAAFEEGAEAGEPFGVSAFDTAELDEQAERLTDIAAAEEELEEMLRA